MIWITQQKHSGPRVEHFVARRRLHLFGNLVLQILDNELMRPVQNGKSVPRDPQSGQPRRSLALRLRYLILSFRLFRDRVQVVSAVVQIGGADRQQHRIFGGVERHPVDRSLASASDLYDWDVFGRREVQFAQVTLFHVVQEVPVDRVRGTFSLQLEDDHSGVVPRGEQVQVGVRRQHPEPVVFPPERVQVVSLRHVPDANALVLAVGQEEFLAWVEQDARDVVVMSAACVDLPGFGIVHSPQLDLAVVRSGDYQRESGVEARPVYSAIVAFENVLDDSVGLTEEIRRAGILQVVFETSGTRSNILFSQPLKRTTIKKND